MKQYLLIAMVILFNSLCAQKGGGVKQDTIPLPAPLKTQKSLEECIEKRRSIRSYSTQELTPKEISTLCWACQGITDSQTGHRAAPSAGATYPLEVYLLKQDGVFRYQPNGHKLIRLSTADERKNMSLAAHVQQDIVDAPVDFVITGIVARTSRRYSDRATRYIYMEMGHAAQNLHLEAVALGLGSVPIGSFFDDDVKKLLSLAPDDITGYIIPVGHPR